jgi:hypothetical protein
MANVGYNLEIKVMEGGEMGNQREGGGRGKGVEEGEGGSSRKQVEGSEGKSWEKEKFGKGGTCRTHMHKRTLTHAHTRTRRSGESDCPCAKRAVGKMPWI